MGQSFLRSTFKVKVPSPGEPPKEVIGVATVSRFLELLMMIYLSGTEIQNPSWSSEWGYIFWHIFGHIFLVICQFVGVFYWSCFLGFSLWVDLECQIQDGFARKVCWVCPVKKGDFKCTMIFGYLGRALPNINIFANLDI
jgi:hypothetical protein